VKVSAGAGTTPDPRVAGPAIYFDTRLDQNKDSGKGRSDPILQAMGER
jgi:hypothetical protein